MMKKEELKELEERIVNGYRISREEAGLLMEADLTELSEAADRIRLHFCGNVCDVCSVAAVKVGQCSEDCLYCAQSTRAKDKVPAECVLGEKVLTDIAVQDKSRGSYRYGLVSVGRRLSKKEVELAVSNVADIRKTADIHVCASLGMLDKEDFTKLHEAGMTMVHNNMETSDEFFKTLCTTHTSDDKRKSIRAAKAAGMKVCSGGLIGLGETLSDRIDLAFSLRELDVDSVPINMLNPIPGTYFEHQEPMKEDEFLRTVAIFRFVLPDTFIRLAAGRAFLPDNGKAALRAGANAVISGDFLTTTGITFETDLQMIREQGYEVGAPKPGTRPTEYSVLDSHIFYALHLPDPLMLQCKLAFGSDMHPHSLAKYNS